MNGVHSLIEVSGGKTYKAGCGEVVTLKKAGPMPKEFTGWSSKVTCDRCRWRPAVWPIVTLMAGWRAVPGDRRWLRLVESDG